MNPHALIRTGAVMTVGTALIIAASPSLALAQQAPTSQTIRYAAVVQYVTGSAERIASAQAGREPIEFKSVLYEGERFATTTGSTLKFRTRNECIAAIYGASQFLTSEAEKPWRVRAEGVRWICPGAAHETVVIRGAAFELSAGSELVLEGKKLLVLSGSVVSKSNAESALPLRKVLTLQDHQWKDSGLPDETQEAWSFNQRLPAPRESADFQLPPQVAAPPAPTPQKEKIVRLIFGPLLGRGGAHFDVSSLDRKNVSSEGARLQLQWKRKTGSFIALANFRDLDEKSQNYEPNVVPADSTTVQSGLKSLEFGYRLQHDRWWSPFFRVGGGVEKTKIYMTRFQSNSYGSGSEAEFYMLSLAFGVDAFYSPSWFPWAGVYGGLDLNLARSLGRGARTLMYENCTGSGAGNACTKPDEAREPWNLTTYSAQVMLGIFAQF